MMKFPWVANKRYNAFGPYLRSLFGVRVRKIGIDAGFTCPNRDGTKGHGGCIYCEGSGSRAPYVNPDLPVIEQIKKGKEILNKKKKPMKFIAYFQAFTNTYAPLERLKQLYEEALQDEDVVGIAIGTRPDAVDEEKLDYIAELSKRTYLWLEYGLQSAHNETLKRINRRHTVEEFIWAVEETKKRGINVAVHIIVGLPFETEEMMFETGLFLSKMPIDGIKIHSLYIPENTPLAKLYRKGKFTPITMDTYVDLVVRILEVLPPGVLIQRLTGDPNPSTLVAPEWTLRKMEILNKIEKELERRNTYQGKLWRGN